MYVRFQSRDSSWQTGKPRGIFAVVHNLKAAGLLSEEEASLFDKTKGWFVDNLPIPPFYDDGNPDRAITWFKSDAAAAAGMLEMLTPLVDMAERYGVSIEVARSDSPGLVVYEDEYQIGVT